jgi:hypothetical protein
MVHDEVRGYAYKTISIFVGFEVLTAVVMKSTIFWDITPCSPLKATCFHDPEYGGDMFLRNVG